jgi:phage terminase Nu1 subunit (DNA packaging protein)
LRFLCFRDANEKRERKKRAAADSLDPRRRSRFKFVADTRPAARRRRPPEKSRGKYDRDECTGWYIRYLQAIVEKRAVVDEGGKIFGSEREERLRLPRADADLRELQLARERSELVAIGDVEREMTNLILTTKARIMAVAPRLAPEILGESSRIMVHAKIEKALQEALLVLSEREVSPEATQPA